MAVDYIGQNLALGDCVVFMQISYRGLMTGNIVHLSPKKLKIKHKATNTCSKESIQFHDQVVKISESLVLNNKKEKIMTLHKVFCVDLIKEQDEILNAIEPYKLDGKIIVITKQTFIDNSKQLLGQEQEGVMKKFFKDMCVILVVYTLNIILSEVFNSLLVGEFTMSGYFGTFYFWVVLFVHIF